MRRSLIIVCLAAQSHCASAVAGETMGTTAARVEPSYRILRTSPRTLAIDRGRWSLDWQSSTSRASLDDRFGKTRKLRGQAMRAQVWRELGAELSFGLDASATRRSLLDRLSPVLPARTHDTAFDLGASLRLGERWTLRAGWFDHGGWGGRSVEKDAIRMVNGEAPARSGTRVAVELPLAPRGSTGSSLTFEAESNSQSVTLGQERRHGSAVAMRLAAAF